MRDPGVVLHHHEQRADRDGTPEHERERKRERQAGCCGRIDARSDERGKTGARAHLAADRDRSCSRRAELNMGQAPRK